MIQVSHVIGAGWTALLLVAVSVLGVWIVRREGGRAWRRLRETISAGRMPAREVADGALILLGGLLLITPGFVTDAIGLLLVLPPTRAAFRGVLTVWVGRRLLGGPAYGVTRVIRVRGTQGPPRRGGPPEPPRVIEPRVIEPGAPAPPDAGPPPAR